jgi:hypothetical protein
VKKQVGGPRCKWESNITMKLWLSELKRMNWIALV